MTGPEGDAHLQEEQISLHFLGELDVAGSDAVDRHLRACAGCGRKAAEIVEVMAALALSPDPGEAPAARRPAGPPEVA